MSYLNSPRLTFSGQFQADPSTVNNDPTHYNNQTFEKDFQNYVGPNMDPANGWWNPDGTGNWRFIGCKIASVTYLDGTTTSDPMLDPIIGMSIMDTDSRTAGKIVDLDSQQQSVSELWGLVVRIVSNDGKTLMKGEYEVAAFTNLWFTRSVDMQADSAAAASYQSIIKNITWDKSFANSRYFNELMATSPDQLSIQFTVDRFNDNNVAPEFTIGRMAGSVGPSSDSEPMHFVPGRQLFPVPNANCFYATAIVDEKLSQVVLDFSNALQFSTGGVVNETRDLRLVINNATDAAPNSFVEIGKINYSAPDWYMGTSGICTFPLTASQLALAQSNPLAILQALTTPRDVFSAEAKTMYTPVYNESAEYVCADQFVFRLNPGDSCTMNFYATNLGKPHPKAIIQIQDGTAAVLGANQTPPIGTPAIPVFVQTPPLEIKTDEKGKASYTFTALDPGNPRGYIEGQVYGITYNLSTQKFVNCNQSNFVSLLLFSGPPQSDVVPDWDNFIQPIMQQYANLYPLMSKGIFNLADKNVVDSNAQLLQLVFSKDPQDPNYMPATRDLSAYKKKVILDYLQSIIDKG
jgi:hypothetical protein